jgi:hypothetical protein
MSDINTLKNQRRKCLYLKRGNHHLKSELKLESPLGIVEQNDYRKLGIND